ncbi:YhhA family cyclophane-containing RiPP [Comamonas aquatilis]|uniref:YhhA family cyclophane-containing RiPP n=1 Tax=Comamonas aquatilis TaxID=1778406 RepID=UPI0039F06257
MYEASFEALAAVAPQSEFSGLFDVDVKTLSSAALARLVEEVRHDDPMVGRAYDRTHNRHNR